MDQTWFEENSTKLKDATAPINTWHEFEKEYGQHEQLQGEDLALVINSKSDFARNHGGDPA